MERYHLRPNLVHPYVERHRRDDSKYDSKDQQECPRRNVPESLS